MLDASQGAGRHVVVVGCGRVGSAVALRLEAGGWDVAVIDERSETFQRLGEGFAGTMIEGHALDTPTLLAAGIVPTFTVGVLTTATFWVVFVGASFPCPWAAHMLLTATKIPIAAANLGAAAMVGLVPVFIIESPHH
jgi:voltage-gated potassium channel Kch